MNSSWSRSLALFTLASLPLLNGCGPAHQVTLPVPWTSEAQFPADYREWFAVFHVRESQQPERTHIGYLLHQVSVNANASPTDEIFWVKDVAHNNVGFVLSNLRAFKLVRNSKKTAGPDGQPAADFSHEDLGIQSREVGVQRIFGLKEGSIVLELRSAQGRKPEESTVDS